MHGLTGLSILNLMVYYNSVMFFHKSFDCTVTPDLRPKSDAHYMCAQDQDFTHTARITVNQIKLVL
jgi:hypothetical protein